MKNIRGKFGLVAGVINRLATLWKSLGVIMAINLLLCGCVTDKEPEGANLQVGDKCPEFSVILNDGSSFSTADMAGHTTLLCFFHTGCPDCQRELPQLQEYYEQTLSDPDFRIICISRAEPAESVQAYWEAHGLTLPYSAQTDRKVYSLFATTGIPRTYLIGPTLLIEEITFTP